MLAEIKNEDEQMAVELFLTINNPSGEKNFWIGLTDFFLLDRWMWEPSHQPATYFNWAKGEPNHKPGEHFAHILSKELDRKWNDLPENGGPYNVWALCQKKN